jgi:hypothetical protein
MVSNPKPVLSNEKARAFEIFKQSYPASEWIESQKAILKEKYSSAKVLGDKAQSIRTNMSSDD